MPTDVLENVGRSINIEKRNVQFCSVGLLQKIISVELSCFFFKGKKGKKMKKKFFSTYSTDRLFRKFFKSVALEGQTIIYMRMVKSKLESMMSGMVCFLLEEGN